MLLVSNIGLDALLGGFVAGLITRLALRGHELHAFESKLTAVGLGFFVPFFFVTSGISFDLEALGSVGALLKLAMLFALFLVVRGAPATLLYRGVFGLGDRGALAFNSAIELPLGVAITAGQMKTSTPAGLAGAAMLSTLVFPLVAAALRGRSIAFRVADDEATVAEHFRVPARAGAAGVADGVPAQAGDHRVGMAGVGVDRDPAAGAGASPALHRAGDSGLESSSPPWRA